MACALHPINLIINCYPPIDIGNVLDVFQGVELTQNMYIVDVEGILGNSMECCGCSQGYLVDFGAYTKRRYQPPLWIFPPLTCGMWPFTTVDKGKELVLAMLWTICTSMAA